MAKIKIYNFYKSSRNPDFNINTIVPIQDKRPLKQAMKKKKHTNVPFESCHILNNSENLIQNNSDHSSLTYFLKRISSEQKNGNHILKLCEELKRDGYYGKEQINQRLFFIKTQPSSLTELQVRELDTDTGEIDILLQPHITNEFKAANNRKKIVLNKFCDFYEPIYKQKKITMLFMTFTRLTHSKILFSDLIDDIKYHLIKQLDRPVRGYFWALEVSEKYHLHYHLCVAIDRLTVKKIPKELKFEKLWGQRTQVTFIKKSVRGYLSKYLAKDSYRVVGLRSYGKSSKYE